MRDRKLNGALLWMMAAAAVAAGCNKAEDPLDRVTQAETGSGGSGGGRGECTPPLHGQCYECRDGFTVIVACEGDPWGPDPGPGPGGGPPVNPPQNPPQNPPPQNPPPSPPPPQPELVSSDEEWGEDGCEEMYEEAQEQGLIFFPGLCRIFQDPPSQGFPGSKPEVNTQLPRDHEGMTSKPGSPPDEQWGRRNVIERLQRVADEWHRRYPGGPRIQIGDISREGGGVFPPHASHHEGRDVDIRVFRNDGVEGGINILTEPNLYDRDRTRELIEVLRDESNGALEWVMLDDPVLIEENLVRPTYRPTRNNPHPPRVHVRHMHVRFRW